MSEKPELDPNKIPRHVAIVMDGNGRWAQERRLPRIMGHKVGVKVVKEVVEAARELGISVLTLYAFSTENWKRPALEVQALMSLLKSYLKAELSNMLENGICLRSMGQIDKLPKGVQQVLAQVSRETADKAGPDPELILNLALSYGSRAEIVRAARILAEKCRQGELAGEDISEDLLAEHLYTAGLPDPDLIIRTSGENRLSNFMLWQASYAEILITRTKWPEFGREGLQDAIRVFQSRERRFGKTGDQIRLG